MKTINEILPIAGWSAYAVGYTKNTLSIKYKFEDVRYLLCPKTRKAAKWLEYYNRERPHSSQNNKSPFTVQGRIGKHPAGEFLARFFRSGTARGATRHALAPLGTQSLRYKIAPQMD